jgi:hypothetical protein
VRNLPASGCKPYPKTTCGASFAAPHGDGPIGGQPQPIVHLPHGTASTELRRQRLSGSGRITRDRLSHCRYSRSRRTLRHARKRLSTCQPRTGCRARSRRSRPAALLPSTGWRRNVRADVSSGDPSNLTSRSAIAVPHPEFVGQRNGSRRTQGRSITRRYCRYSGINRKGA